MDFIAQKYEEFNAEIHSIEKRIEEGIGLRSELSYRIEEALLRTIRNWRLRSVERFFITIDPLSYKYKEILPRATTDWDFPTDGYEYYTALYVSPPSSLHFTAAPRCILCKYTGTTALRDGRVVTYMYRMSVYAGMGITFRNQEPVGNVSLDNTYYWRAYAESVDLEKSVGGVKTIIDYEKVYPPEDTWFKVRVTWWSVPGVGIVLRTEKYDGDWVQWCRDFLDISDEWKDSSINRVGIAMTDWASGGSFFDDTEIWG